ncbi:hypothetical protein [Tychonema sp. LEGE 07203]|uniref:hypothetical protein n=1 Tax=Tychonema sp. LEGE 07203 TaxID=1828671 RepID=UPI00187F2939|nr:hypothetical protein [Tychonema sp. LEGE 07203]MBE9094205.1 hypothetical protein [Tychonema sp. LEGE 07203]
MRIEMGDRTFFDRGRSYFFEPIRFTGKKARATADMSHLKSGCMGMITNRW